MSYINRTNFTLGTRLKFQNCLLFHNLFRNTMDCSVESSHHHPLPMRAVMLHLLLYAPVPVLSMLLQVLDVCSNPGPIPFIMQPAYFYYWATVSVFLALIAYGSNVSMVHKYSCTASCLSNGLRAVLVVLGPLLHIFLYNDLRNGYTRGLSIMLVLAPLIHYCYYIVKLGKHFIILAVMGFTIFYLWKYTDDSLETLVISVGILFTTFLVAYTFSSTRHIPSYFASMPIAAFSLSTHGTVTTLNKNGVSLVRYFGYNCPKALLESAVTNHGGKSILELASNLNSGSEGIAHINFFQKDLTKPLEYILFKHYSSIGILLKGVNKDRQWENELRSGLLCSLSHELCTPLNAILPLLRLLPPNPSDNGQTQEIVLSNAELLHSKIQDLLDFTKLEMHEIKHTFQSFEVGKLFDELHAIFRYEAESKNNKLSFVLDSRGYLRIIADRQRIKQVLVKLISNAIKFTSKGLVEVSAKTLKSCNDIQFCVLDTGIGMSEENRKSLFEPLTKKHAFLSRKWNSLRLAGMGLTMSQKICESLGGKLEVFSKLRKGTVFTFVLTNCRIMECFGKRQPRLEKTPSISTRKSNCVQSQKSLVLDRALLRRSSKDVGVVYVNDSVIRRESTKMSGTSIEECDDIPEELVIKKAEPKSPTRMLKSDLDVVEQARLVPLARQIRVSMTDTADLMDDGCPLLKGYKQFKASEEKVKLHKTLQSIEEELKNEQVNSPPTVLVVDDGACNRYVLKSLLKKLNVNVVEATDGGQAFEIVRRNFEGQIKDRLKLILMDLEMPKVDGIEATRRIRNMEYQMNRDIEIPIVAVTAFDSESIRASCFNARMQMFLTKPVEYKMLLEVVQKYVR